MTEGSKKLEGFELPDFRKINELQKELTQAIELIGKLEESARDVIGCELRMYGSLSKDRMNNMSTAVFLLNEAVEEIAKWKENK